MGTFAANSLGNRQNYGTVDTYEGVGATVHTTGIKNTLVVEFDYANLPTFSAVYQDIPAIPADSLITAAYLHVETAAAGGTSYNIGLYTAAGVAIDADGIDAGVLTAALTEDAWIVNDGDLVGATIGATAGQVVVAATGTFTAGEYMLIIEYISPRA